MKIHVEIDEQELRQMIIARFRELMPDTRINEPDVQIEVKSKQNYRSEWESAAFRASIRKG